MKELRKEIMMTIYDLLDDLDEKELDLLREIIDSIYKRDTNAAKELVVEYCDYYV